MAPDTLSSAIPASGSSTEAKAHRQELLGVESARDAISQRRRRVATLAHPKASAREAGRVGD